MPSLLVTFPDSFLQFTLFCYLLSSPRPNIICFAGKAIGIEVSIVLTQWTFRLCVSPRFLYGVNITTQRFLPIGTKKLVIYRKIIFFFRVYRVERRSKPNLWGELGKVLARVDTAVNCTYWVVGQITNSSETKKFRLQIVDSDSKTQKRTGKSVDKDIPYESRVQRDLPPGPSTNAFVTFVWTERLTANSFVLSNTFQTRW